MLVAAGVPVSLPVAASNVAQLGKPVIEKLTVPPVADTLGWNIYTAPSTTVASGVPDKWIVGEGEADDEAVELADVPDEAGAVSAEP